MFRHLKIATILIATATLIACEKNEKDAILSAAISIAWIDMGLNELCVKLEDSKIISTTKLTAGTENNPAYIVDFSTVCVTPLEGKKTWRLYLGWVRSEAAKSIYCMQWNKDKDVLLNGRGWITCGGLNKT
jgi:hypothetical protein